jgi:hypothetical protein
MKKISLLYIIFLTVFLATTLSAGNVADNQQNINVQNSSGISVSNDFIDNLAVYPNPVVDILKVSFKSSKKSKAVISLFNNIGKQVYSQEFSVEQGNNLFSIDVRSKAIEPGIYFVQIVVETEVFTKKLIVK